MPNVFSHHASMLHNSKPNVVAIIPARLASTRFPRKVLADATGKPLIAHVYERAKLARTVSRVVIATDHAQVLSAVHAFGGEAIMTSPSHPNGTSRLAQAARDLSLAPADIVINVQGDEPELDPAAIDAAVHALRTTNANVATVASPIDNLADFTNPAIVKVVLKRDGTALYFSRANIPFDRDAQGELAPVKPLRHVGLYAYSAAYLQIYAALEPTPLESTEMLEQLRVLEHGGSIAVAIHPCKGEGIDTPAQYAAFVARWKAANPS